MSVKSKVFAAAATLTLVGGVGVAGLATAGAANAATPSCGGSCIDIFSHQFGTFADPSFVMDSFKQGDVAGTPVILFRTSNSDPAEDFTVDSEGLVSQFYALGLVSPQVDLQFGCSPTLGATTTCAGTGQGDYWAYEFMYSPYGVQTGLCTGVAATAVAGEHVTLQPCGVSSKTLWIAANPAHEACDYSFTLKECTNPLFGIHFPLSAYEEALVNGSDTNFSTPYGLTYGQSSYPTDTPRPPLYVDNVLGFSTGAINTNQLWSADGGVLP
jgi:hypothetical protein